MMASPAMSPEAVAIEYFRCVAGESVQGMCERLAQVSGFKARTVDVLIWRACATGIMDSRTGALR